MNTDSQCAYAVWSSSTSPSPARSPAEGISSAKCELIAATHYKQDPTDKINSDHGLRAVLKTNSTPATHSVPAQACDLKSCAKVLSPTCVMYDRRIQTSSVQLKQGSTYGIKAEAPQRPGLTQAMRAHRLCLGPRPCTQAIAADSSTADANSAYA